jgi:ribosomal protein L12E/L44/L45/RPP1/RPP2
VLTAASVNLVLTAAEDKDEDKDEEAEEEEEENDEETSSLISLPVLSNMPN